MNSEPNRLNNSIQSKEEAFGVLSNIILLLQSLSDNQKQAFLKSLNKNPIRQIIESEYFSISQIYNYEAFDYFIFAPDREGEKLYLINKDDIKTVAKNLKICIKNGLKNDRKYLLN